ncbi:hypothetical protein DHEL01_v213132 [Diaporthe helianthi]|uniref:Cytochrome P450 n=1 Tax=Diaporthe helianthi TaxID=158607 RepID=A0A2P5HDY8_DIAHE|nr:hypothetical protein DHEL01_v213132 [Diaporthe helianthi]
MYQWISHQVMMAVTEGIYEPLNPFLDDSAVPAFRGFEAGVHGSSRSSPARFLPSRLGATSDPARRYLTTPYRRLSGHVVYHIVSAPAVLADCREKLIRALSLGREQNGEAAATARIGILSRVILEDHLLDDRFLLKKGNILLIPGVVQHQEPSVWGDNVNEFYHKRFVEGPGGRKGSRRLNPVAFRALGRGSTLCPGRHFAATEIMAFAALFILQFDARPASGAEWSVPSVDKTNLL